MADTEKRFALLDKEGRTCQFVRANSFGLAENGMFFYLMDASGKQIAALSTALIAGVLESDHLMD